MMLQLQFNNRVALSSCNRPGYKDENGFYPKNVMLDHNVHMMFAHAGIYRNGSGFFGETQIIPVANIEGGVTWKAVDPAPGGNKFDDFDDDIPF